MTLEVGTEIPELDVLIVGAGLSGLTSAVKIIAKEKALTLKLLDENSRPGGQLVYPEVGGGGGGKWANDGQEQIIRLMHILHVTPHKRSSQTKKMKRCWDLDRGLTAMPAKFELKRYLNMLEIRMQNFLPGRFRLRSDAPTIKRHIDSCLFFSKSRLFMYNLVELVCGLAADVVKYDEFMSLCSSCGGVKNILELYYEVPNKLYDISGNTLVQHAIDRIKYTEILRNRAVVRVRHLKNYVEIEDSTGQVHTAEVLILAIPWNRVEQISFEPDMPAEFRAAGSRSEPTSPKHMLTSFVARYNTSLWGESGYSGSYLCSQPLILGHEMRATTYAGMMLHMPGEEVSLRDFVLSKLAKHFGDEMRTPKDYKQFSFELNAAVHVPQTTPWHRIIWSSSAAAGTCYRNQLSGAVQSGMRAALNALFLLRPQVVTWRDLMDLEYSNPYAGQNVGFIGRLSSRLNLYNVTFYSVFVAGLLLLLDRGHKSQMIIGIISGSGGVS